MDWTAIIAASELIGAVAVVVSVSYLALQIRSQTAESRLAATRDPATKRADALRYLAGDDDLIQIWLKAIRDYESLRGSDRMKASLVFNLIMRNAEQDFIHKGTGHADDPYLESVDRVLSQNVAPPGLKQWWATTGNLFNQDFQAHVNHLMQNADEGALNDAFMPSWRG
ncbi:MAG: hypothetical protein RIC85_02955 [Gammaproteobacteria bacterium]